MPQETADDLAVMPRFYEYVKTIRDLWDAFNSGDYQRTLSLTHPEIEMQDYPAMPDAEWHRGLDGANAWAAKMWQSFGQVVIDPYEFVPISRDQMIVLVRVRVTGRRGGVTGELRVAALVGMRDGLCARMALYENKAQALRGAADLLEAVGLPE